MNYPKYAQIEDRIYEINTDFKVAIKCDEIARDVAVQAVLGSAKLLKECGGDIDLWVNKVCSPGGTTIQGINSLKEADLEKTVADAFYKSYKRDIELSGN